MKDQSEHSIGRKLGRVGFSGPKPMPFSLLCFLFEDPSCPLCGPHMLEEAALCCAGLRANCKLLFPTVWSVALRRLLKIIHGRSIHSTGIGKCRTSLFVGWLLLLSVCLLFVMATLRGVRLCLIVVLICVSLMITDAEHFLCAYRLFVYLLWRNV